MKLVTVEQMRELERHTEEAGVSTATLMENAGLNVAQEVWMLLGSLDERRILVLAGPGNNGGDGLVAARHLYEWGAQVAVYLSAPRPDDDPYLAELVQREIPITLASRDDGYDVLEGLVGAAELVIDALLGTGRSRPIEGDLAEVMRRLGDARDRPMKPRLVAVDLPTGVDADSGAADPLTVRADLTVALAHPKVGLYSGAGVDFVGRIQEVDIGVPAELSRALPLELLDRAWAKRSLPARPADSNKGTFGRVVVAAGSRNLVGASVLAATAAYRAGAGYVTLAIPECIFPIVAGRVLETTFLPLADADGHVTDAAAVALLDALPEQATLLVGPGLGPSADGFVRALLSDARMAELRGLVLDGDALNALSRWPEWRAQLAAVPVLTPHPGEMARLAGIEVKDVQGRRMALAAESARAWNAVVVLKGAGTVIAAPDGRLWLAPFANPALATAGSGDVLAGAIAGLLAQGLEAATAAACGVFLHGMAGDAARKELGPAGVMAGDLLPELPRAFKSLVEPSPPASGGPMGGLFGQGGMGNMGGLAGMGGMDPGALGGLGGMGGGLPGGLAGLAGLGNPQP